MSVKTEHVTYLNTVGVVSVSEGTEYRVSYAKTLDSLQTKVSVQIWWKGDEKDTWKPGKGFVVTKEIAYAISKKIDEAISSHDNCELYVDWTDSQQFVISKNTEKDLIIICKRWHRGDFNWINGKSIALGSLGMQELSRFMRNCYLKQK